MRGNQEYQRQLAESLIAMLGAEGAFDFARQNLWDGVLAHISVERATLAADGAEHSAAKGSGGHRPH